LRESIERHFEKPLAALLVGVMARERAALFLSIIAGFQVMRQVIGISALAEADATALSRRLADLFQILIVPDQKQP